MWMASCMFCMKFKCIDVSVDCSRANRMNKMLSRSVHMPCISTYMWTNSQRKRSEALRNGIYSEMKCFYCQKLFKIQFEIWTLRSKHSNLTITIFRWNFIRTGCVCVCCDIGSWVCCACLCLWACWYESVNEAVDIFAGLNINTRQH